MCQFTFRMFTLDYGDKESCTIVELRPNIFCFCKNLVVLARKMVVKTILDETVHFLHN